MQSTPREFLLPHSDFELLRAKVLGHPHDWPDDEVDDLDVELSICVQKEAALACGNDLGLWLPTLLKLPRARSCMWLTWTADMRRASDGLSGLLDLLGNTRQCLAYRAAYELIGDTARSRYLDSIIEVVDPLRSNAPWTLTDPLKAKLKALPDAFWHDDGAREFRLRFAAKHPTWYFQLT